MFYKFYIIFCEFSRSQIVLFDRISMLYQVLLDCALIGPLAEQAVVNLVPVQFQLNLSAQPSCGQVVLALLTPTIY